jgi:thiamine-phosphate pyrophosphorylase
MPQKCILYYITDRSAFPGDEHARRERLLEKIAEAAANGIDYIQLREKDLSVRELESLAAEGIRIIRSGLKSSAHRHTAILINSRTDVALAAGADGVHLPADDISPEEVRFAWKQASSTPTMATSLADPVISVSCHSLEDVARAAVSGATFALFAPVFEKKDAPGAAGTGLADLSAACSAQIPVLALGGVNLANAASCLHAGAAGIAAIRLFQNNDIAGIVRALRI